MQVPDHRRQEAWALKLLFTQLAVRDKGLKIISFPCGFEASPFVYLIVIGIPITQDRNSILFNIQYEQTAR